MQIYAFNLSSFDGHFAFACLLIALRRFEVDFVFDKMFLAGKLDTPGMGFMYCSRLEKAATYIPANVLDEIQN